MWNLLIMICICLMPSVVLGQTTAGQGKDEKVKEELRKLHADYQEAGTKRDRAALERIFADGYVWVQANGRVVTKAQHIENIMGNTSTFAAPNVSLDQLTVYGDSAILRETEREGLFATTVFTKKDGRWQFAHAQGTIRPPERKAIEIDPKLLDAFVGSYEFGTGGVAVATKEGSALMWKGGRRPKVRLIPLSDSRFFVEESGVEMTFHKDDKGQRVTSVTLRIGTCQDSLAKRVE